MKDLTNIGKLVYLSLHDLVGDRVYPLVAEQTTKFPFIIYRTGASRPLDEKDDIWPDWQYNVIVDVVSDKYDKCVEICDQALESFQSLENELDIQINSVQENWQDDAYVREIDITIHK